MKVAELRYKAWGETRYTWGTTPTTYRYTGQREQAEIGLYYYGARWYDSALGRFTQPDTIVPDPADPQQLGRYTYVRNSPLCYVDPSGHALEGSATGDDPYRNRNPSRYYGPKSKEAPAETDYMAFYEYQYGLRAVDPNPIVGIGGWLPGEELECAAYGNAYHAYTFQAGYSSTQEFVDNVLPFLGEAIGAVGATLIGTNAYSLGTGATSQPTMDEEIYQFSGKRGGFRNELREGEEAMSGWRSAEFQSPRDAYRAAFGEEPSPEARYRVTTVSEASQGSYYSGRYHPGFYPQYDGGGHVSLYGQEFSPNFNRIWHGPYPFR